MKLLSRLDLSALTWHAFSREAMFDSRWYLRPQRLVVYTATMLIGMAAQGAATYCMFKYKFLRQHIGNFSMHAAHVHNVDITASTILSMIFPCFLLLLLNVEYFVLLFYPAKKFSPKYNATLGWSMAGVTIGMVATVLLSTIVVATRSASISGVDAATAQQLTDLYFRPPFKYLSWPQNIAWVVLMWISLVLNFLSAILMRLASTHDSREGSNLIASTIEDRTSETDAVEPISREGKTSEVTVDEKIVTEVV